MAIMSAFQAEDVGSIPITCSKTQIGPTQRTYSYGSAVVGKPTQG